MLRCFTANRRGHHGTFGHCGKDSRPSRRSADDSLDAVDLRLLELVQAEGRITLSELGRRVSLSPAAVGERIRRMEASGTITGYTALVSPVRLGYGMQAFVRVAPHAGYTLRHPRTVELMARAEIIEAHHVVGDACWLFRVAMRDISHLEEMLEAISVLGRTTTSIVMSSPLERKALLPH